MGKKAMMPEKIALPHFGGVPTGTLTPLETGQRIFGPSGIEFAIKRVYWITSVGDWQHWEIKRGGHAHRETSQLFFCLKGRIDFVCDGFHMRTYKGRTTFQLDGEEPHVGLYMPPLWWHEMIYRKGSICLAIASSTYDEKDYIRNHEEFDRLVRPPGRPILGARQTHPKGTFAEQGGPRA